MHTMKPRRRTPRLQAIGLALCLVTASAMADEKRDLEQLRATTLALIEALVSQGLLTRERADALLRQASAKADATTVPPAVAATPPAPAWGAPPKPAAPPPVVRVPYLSETVRAQLRDEIKADVIATAKQENWIDPLPLPEWLRMVTFEADLRVRWQSDLFEAPVYLTDPTTGAIVGGPCDIVGGNLPAECYRAQTVVGASPAWSPDLINTTIDRDRMLLRARLGMYAQLSDTTNMGLRLTTGTIVGPTSTSQTMGNYFNKSSFVLDLAFIRWAPRPDLRLIAGRMPNPFYVASDLVWPRDLSFDGVALQGDYLLAPNLSAFATAGAFPLEEFNVAARDKWLYAAQVGADWGISSKSRLRVGLAYYDFANIEGVQETTLPPVEPRLLTTGYQSSAYPATVRLKGNTLININAPGSTALATWGLASQFRPINLTAGLSMAVFEPYVLNVGLDWVKNTAFNLADIRQRSGLSNLELEAKTTGLQASVEFGRAKLNVMGDWLVGATFRRIERDAWIDGFTDTTWHLGGTNYQGWQIGGLYAIDRHLALGIRYTSTRNLDDGVRTPVGNPPVPTGNLSSAPLKIDVLQVDLNAWF
jgi:hypothetical protein